MLEADQLGEYALAGLLGTLEDHPLVGEVHGPGVDGGRGRLALDVVTPVGPNPVAHGVAPKAAGGDRYPGRAALVVTTPPAIFHQGGSRHLNENSLAGGQHDVAAAAAAETLGQLEILRVPITPPLPLGECLSVLLLRLLGSMLVKHPRYLRRRTVGCSRHYGRHQ